MVARRSRSYQDILRANILTPFNALLGTLALVVLVIGPPQDALFGLIVIVNSSIGIVQEVRAKWTLDRLRLLAAPQPRRTPDGRVLLTRGEQAADDGLVAESDGLEMDESLITGEAEPVPKRAGDRILSGTFAVSGTGSFSVTASGEDSYAQRLAAEARRFKLANSELRRGINRFLGVIAWVLPVLAVLLVVSQFRAADDVRLAARHAIAGVVTLVPEGLVLLTSLSMAAAVIRLGRRRVLVQDLAAVEVLARVDTVLTDKTGTLTAGGVAFDSLEVLEGGESEVRAALGALAAIEASASPSLAAIAAAVPAPAWTSLSHQPFSSARGWSEAAFAGHGTWRIGAPERLGAGGGRAEALAASGRRVLALLRDGRPVALAVLRERVRPEAAGTVRYFASEGVEVRIISGDSPLTATAVAREVGIPERGVAGRMAPADKRALVERLRAEGRVVAVIGDGVNDVPALKAADIGIAMGSGSEASRAVAQVVMLDSDFSTLPAVVAEGRRVIANTERLSSLYFTKTVYAAFLALAVALAGIPFPFLPRHLTLVAAFTIGVPSFFLALAPNTTRARPGFLRRSLLVSVPAGAAAGLSTYLAYSLALDEPGVTPEQASTLATLVLAAVGLWFLTVLVRPWTRARGVLVWLMAAGLTAGMAWPPARAFFGLDMPRPLVLMAGFGVAALTGAAMEVTAAAAWTAGRYRLPGWVRPPGRRPRPSRPGPPAGA
jgi:cation-transporting P-type ATPase E